MKKVLPKRHLHSEKAVFDLVSTKGISKSICISKLGLPANYFNAYSGTDDNFNSAMATFTTDVLMESVTNNLCMDGAGRKYLMQKLRVFDKEIDLPVKKMTTAKHASQNLSYALNAYARKEIGDDTLQQIRSACETFSKLMIATDIEMRLSEIERKFNAND